MIYVTGGAGFIGSRLIRKLNEAGYTEITVVDDLTDGRKCLNLSNLKFEDYLDKEDFRPLMANWLDDFEQCEDKENYQSDACIIHLGACSDTTEWNGKFMMENNYEYTKDLMCMADILGIPFIYASSAAVYGGNQVFHESPDHESPLNVYGFSKLMVDNYFRANTDLFDTQIVGLRFFNVYGPGEAHKGSMASVAYHFNEQCKKNNEVKLFEGHDGFKDGEQRRDFVYVDDVVSVILYFLFENPMSGIFNVGTGHAQSFNDVAHAVVGWHKKGQIQYIPFPDHLKGCYQNYTQADLGLLRKAGYNKPFRSVEEGVKAYLDEIEGVTVAKEKRHA